MKKIGIQRLRSGKKINDPWYGYWLMMRQINQIEKESKKPLTKPEPCPYSRTGWWEHQYICTDCGEVLKEKKVLRKDGGNHIKRSSSRQ